MIYTKNVNKVIDSLKEHPFSSVTEITTRTGITRTTVLSIVKRLYAEGVADRTEVNGNPPFFLYRIK